MVEKHQQSKVIDVADQITTEKTELNISTEKVCYIIIKAREFDVKVPPIEPNPGSNPADMQQREVLEDYIDDPTYAELRDAINALNDDEKADLVALAWMGRGDFDPTSWQQARLQAQEQDQHQKQHTARYLTGMPMLGDFLEEGLAALGHSCEEFEINRL